MIQQNATSLTSGLREDAPDIETASADYATRFMGKAGAYLLAVQHETVRSLLKPYRGAGILEVGGGHGQLRSLYAELGGTFILHGSNTKCFARLDSEAPNESRVVSDLRMLPFSDNAIDVVIGVRLLCHLSDWELVLQEMCRVAAIAVVFDFPTKRSLNALTPIMFNMKKKVERNTRHYESFWPSAFTKILAAHGFSAIRRKNQFFLPMVLHRVLGGSVLATSTERACRLLGLTTFFGSPVAQIALRPEYRPRRRLLVNH